MKKYAAFYPIIAVGVLILISLEGLCFAGGNEIKARMQERLPTLDQMKTEGIIGENNLGFLEFVPGAAKQKQDVVKAENQDRQTVYDAIARQQKTTAEFVGKRRAIQIAEKAEPGVWLQDSSGNWYKK